MSTRKRAGAGLITVALAGSLLSTFGFGGVAAAGPTVGQPTIDAGRGATPQRQEVTLVTGDRVTLAPDGTISVQPGTGRSGIRFHTYTHNGHTNVIPSDAAPLFGSGRLDPRLFDVTTLAESGYLTAKGELPLIVTGDARNRTAARSALTRGGAAVTGDLPAISGVAVKSRHANATKFWQEVTEADPATKGRKLRTGVRGIWLDGLRKTTLVNSVPQVGAPTAWSAGYDGTGVKVAVVDSGIDTTHPDLNGTKVIAAQNFTTESGTTDLAGHGTHVASTIAGTGAASGGTHKGVAPGASLLNAKVCRQDNTCQESAILNGMTWAAQQGADVINMSLGGADTPGLDPLETAVNNLTSTYGSLFVIASGNTPSGAGDYTVSSPSTADAAVSVGAVDPGNNLAWFSNRGPRRDDTALKPDITAPGVAIEAARSSTSSLPASGPGGQYTIQNGTSMASPHVAGGAAILVQRRPTWTPAQLKAGLMGSASPQANATAFQQGAGRLEVSRAYNQSVLADPPSVSLGRALWPHGDDPVVTRTITYTNTNTSSAANLTVSVSAKDPTGAPAPAGMFTVSPTTLSLAPGGTGTVTLTSTTSVAGPDGLYGGWVLATGSGGIQVQTPFGVHRAPEGKEITLHHRDRAGNYVGYYWSLLLPTNPALPVHNIAGRPAGPHTIWVEKGNYLFFNQITEPNGTDHSFLINPKLAVDGSTSPTIDVNAATAQPVTVTVPDPAARKWTVEMGGQLKDGDNYAPAGTIVTQPGNLYTKQLGTASHVYGFIGKLRYYLAVPSSGTDLRNSPTVYHLAWFPEQQWPTGLTKNVTAAQLATVTASHARQVTGSTGYKDAQAHPGGEYFRNTGSISLPFDLPFTRTEYYNTEGNVRWWSQFREQVDSPSAIIMDFESGLRTYTAGTTTTEAWNKPVYGPSLTNQVRPLDWVVRSGDHMQLNPPMFSDSDGHAGQPLFASGISGSVVLKRNGTTLHNLNYNGGYWIVAVPAGFATYNLEVTANRSAPIELSTQNSAVWTFTSDTVSPTTNLKLPLWAVTFKPTLNASHQAPKNTTFSIPLTAAAQPTSPVSGINTFTVQYSTNDGATWTNATLTGSGASRTASVTHPNITGYVSLRATVTDWAGNSVTQTTIRAYKIG